jgi:hypothetical protein
MKPCKIRKIERTGRKWIIVPALSAKKPIPQIMNRRTATI